MLTKAQAAIQGRMADYVHLGEQPPLSVYHADTLALLADLEAMGRALEPFAAIAPAFHVRRPDAEIVLIGWIGDEEVGVTIGDLRRAAAAGGE